MRFFKYLFIIALFIGFTPLLTSCSDDDDTPSIEGYWYADLQTEPEMVVFKNGNVHEWAFAKGNEKWH